MIAFPAEPEGPYHFQRLAEAGGCRRVIGIDEAGRGPLAGPVVAAAVVLAPGYELPGLNDSKKLNEKQRNDLFDRLAHAPEVAIGIGIAWPEEIDRLNILRATWQAMYRAAVDLRGDFILVDGNPVPDLPAPSHNIVKGDARCACIAAASIVAKVTRDRHMVDADGDHPAYGFARHKGYPTPAHLAALRAHGPCPLHRRSFRPVADLLTPNPGQAELVF